VDDFVFIQEKMTFSNFTKSENPPPYTKNSNLFNLHAHNIFTWDKFNYYRLMLYRPCMSFPSLKFPNQNYVGVCIFSYQHSCFVPLQFCPARQSTEEAKL